MVARKCPYGHADGSARGHCLGEIHSKLLGLKLEQADRADRGDLSGARHTGRHIDRWWRKLDPTEQAAYARSQDRGA
jgi:hypothetical protein